MSQGETKAFTAAEDISQLFGQGLQAAQFTAAVHGYATVGQYVSAIESGVSPAANAGTNVGTATSNAVKNTAPLAGAAAQYVTAAMDHQFTAAVSKAHASGTLLAGDSGFSGGVGSGAPAAGAAAKKNTDAVHISSLRAHRGPAGRHEPDALLRLGRGRRTSEVDNATHHLIQAARDTLQQGGADATENGHQLGQMYAQGIQGETGSVDGAIQALISAARDGLQQGGADATQNGQQLGEDFAQSIQGEEGAVQSAVTSLLNAVQTTLERVPPLAQTNGQQTGERFASSIQGEAGAAGSAASACASAAGTGFESAVPEAAAAGQNAGAAFANAISSQVGAAESAPRQAQPQPWRPPKPSSSSTRRPVSSGKSVKGWSLVSSVVSALV